MKDCIPVGLHEKSVLHSVPNRKPVQSFQEEANMPSLVGSRNKAGSMVLELLQLLDLNIWQSI